MKIFLKTWVCLLFVCGLVKITDAYESFTVDFNGKLQTIYYQLYMPQVSSAKRFPVLVCTGGLPIIEGQYVHSDPTECTGENWEKFADEEHFAILGLGFLFNEEDWKNSESYQHPNAWSGNALKSLLKQLSKEYRIDPNQLYLFGISAGAQFSVRYAFFQPKAVKAVAAHAAGGFDEPKKRIKTKFMITVGSQDNKEIDRVAWALFFMTLAREKNIDVKAVLIPGLDHRQTEAQNQMSRDFFKDVRGGKF